MSKYIEPIPHAPTVQEIAAHLRALALTKAWNDPMLAAMVLAVLDNRNELRESVKDLSVILACLYEGHYDDDEPTKVRDVIDEAQRKASRALASPPAEGR